MQLIRAIASCLHLNEKDLAESRGYDVDLVVSCTVVPRLDHISSKHEIARRSPLSQSADGMAFLRVIFSCHRCQENE